MRQIFLDTETTGIEPRQGHRIIEVAGVEMENRRFTGRQLHHYVNPEREIDAGAQAVHGISNAFLEDKPRFADIARELQEFIRDAELVIHNAAFDIGFLDAEFARLDLPQTRQICNGVQDTLKMARELHPGKRNNLDALCERYQINNAHRTLHGALLDAELLAEVYLAMTRGQESLIMDQPAAGNSPALQDLVKQAPRQRGPLLVRRAEGEDLEAHRRVLEGIQKDSKGACLWLQAPEVAVSEA
ncbi:MAG: DNA polymerase III subunit epsilon [Azovibrio sp.]|uniref:DNA polymerase III subunit epsilon n=1 Tax=Azovibrio sp. TaxID=1872673 RepID=UPI003C73A5C7